MTTVVAGHRRRQLHDRGRARPGRRGGGVEVLGRRPRTDPAGQGLAGEPRRRGGPGPAARALSTGCASSVAVAAPLRPVETPTAALPEPGADTGRLRVVGDGAAHGGRSGFGAGRPVPARRPRLTGDGPVVVVVPSGTGTSSGRGLLRGPGAPAGWWPPCCSRTTRRCSSANRLRGRRTGRRRGAPSTTVLAADGSRSRSPATAAAAHADRPAAAGRPPRASRERAWPTRPRGRPAAATLPTPWSRSTPARPPHVGAAPAGSTVAGAGRLPFLARRTRADRGAAGRARPRLRPPPGDGAVDGSTTSGPSTSRRSAADRARPRSAAPRPGRSPSPRCPRRRRVRRPGRRPRRRLGVPVRAAPLRGGGRPARRARRLPARPGRRRRRRPRRRHHRRRRPDGAVVAAGAGDLLTVCGRRADRRDGGGRGVGQARPGRTGSRLPRCSSARTARGTSSTGRRRPRRSARWSSAARPGCSRSTATIAPGEWRALRLRLKADLLGGNVARALRTLERAPRHRRRRRRARPPTTRCWPRSPEPCPTASRSAAATSGARSATGTPSRTACCARARTPQAPG